MNGAAPPTASPGLGLPTSGASSDHRMPSGRGDLTFLNVDNPKVLAFLRRYEEETLLIVVNLSKFAQVRNKRMVDVVVALGFILVWPLFIAFVKNPLGLFVNSFRVLAGSNTWVGYAEGQDINKHLPKIPF